ncbi:transcription factor TFIIE beta subunit, TFIIEB, Tfa2 [Coemansia sp. RSA 1813]|nr:transcription factor TFIIE beta subunit, TFIIEB, Tfa2 [Coemansia sp. RSA 1843]KAJ2215690.1 transcription factor TFIIE beta subunit, TFIIEB, Tfa2 [Coemansia sp. RSA 487]KAJ2568435.1 transcription factor TFIIE beta subunit, TFIIEB, Tfa2 [Coemansia sp. RSA 1813]
MSDPFTKSLGFKGRTISTALSTKVTPQPQTASTPPGGTGTGTGIHGYDGANVLTRVSQIIDFLKKSQRPCGADEIRLHIHEFDEASAEFEHLTNNAKVSYSDGMFAYKPEYDLRTPEDLVEFLRGIPDYGGLEVKKLSDSYLGNVSAVISELRQKKHILAITDKDSRPRYIFYNCKLLDTEVNDEIKTNWARLPVPDEQELANEMDKAGLQQTKSEKSHVQEQQDVKKPKKAARKTRITNTHLEDIDLTKDFVPSGK